MSLLTLNQGSQVLESSTAKSALQRANAAMKYGVRMVRPVSSGSQCRGGIGRFTANFLLHAEGAFEATPLNLH